VKISVISNRICKKPNKVYGKTLCKSTEIFRRYQKVKKDEVHHKRRKLLNDAKKEAPATAEAFM